MNHAVSGDEVAYSQEEIDALAYSYVLSHGYEGALALFDGFVACHQQSTAGRGDALAGLCRYIRQAIDDEAATISRLLDRIVEVPMNGAPQALGTLSLSRPNPIDRHIGARLQQRRIQCGISLVKLAADLATIPEQLAAIEDGTLRLDADGLQRVSASLDVPLMYFFQAASPENDTGNTPLQLKA